MTIDTEEPVARAVVAAIHTGDVEALRRLLHEHPGLATARLGKEPGGEDCAMTRSLLHVATDWPGHYPNGAATVAALVEAGAATPGSPVPTARRPCTGRRVATTSRCSMPSSTPAPTSRHLVR